MDKGKFHAGVKVCIFHVENRVHLRLPVHVQIIEKSLGTHLMLNTITYHRYNCTGTTTGTQMYTTSIIQIFDVTQPCDIVLSHSMHRGQIVAFPHLHRAV